MKWRLDDSALPKPGEIRVDPVKGKGTTDVPHGVIHDWRASAVAPGASAAKVIAVLQDYDRYKTTFAPGVVDSKLLSHEGDRWHPFLRLYKKKIIAAVLNSEYDVEYRKLDQQRWAVISRSTRIAEVEDGKELPPGTGHGFLWRLNAYWLIEQRPDSVYIECRTLSLTRDVPSGLGWIVKPIVSSLPPESLRDTLEATIRAVR